MGVDRIRLARVLAAIVADSPMPGELPRRLCTACLTVLPVDGVGVSLMSQDEPGGRMLLGASDVVSTQLEELQFDLGEGPCVSAFGDARPVIVSDMRAEEARVRWPVFTAEARGLGVGALFAFPLQVGASGVGVLDCHRVRAGVLDEVAETLAVADAVTMALLNYQARLTEGVITTEGAELFDLSWRNHAEVHQATGAVAMQLGISTGEALARLRAHAFSHSRPLRAVAADVLAGRLRLLREGSG
jgi:hypothetical protein